MGYIIITHKYVHLINQTPSKQSDITTGTLTMLPLNLIVAIPLLY